MWGKELFTRGICTGDSWHIWKAVFLTVLQIGLVRCASLVTIFFIMALLSEVCPPWDMCLWWVDPCGMCWTHCIILQSIAHGKSFKYGKYMKNTWHRGWGYRRLNCQSFRICGTSWALWLVIKDNMYYMPFNSQLTMGQIHLQMMMLRQEPLVPVKKWWELCLTSLWLALLFGDDRDSDEDGGLWRWWFVCCVFGLFLVSSHL